jgi:hypothetical protein
MTNQKSVFVIMPFSSTPTCTEAQWTEIYENVFKPAIEECGYLCERAMPKVGSLINSIVDKLRLARIVLADVTDRNPNVFYELGVRHALSKRTIIITQDSSHIPSDLRGYWFIQYGTSPGLVTKFKRDIKAIVAGIESTPDKSDSPVSDYLEQEHADVSRFINKENIKKLTALYTELTGNVLMLNYLKENFSKGYYGYVYISTDCLRLLLSTVYVDLGPEILKQAYELLNQLMLVDRKAAGETLVHSALADCQTLATEVLGLRDQLARGEYAEPEKVSTMIWRPIEQPLTETAWRASCNVLATRRITEGVKDSRNSEGEYSWEISKCMVCAGTGMISDMKKEGNKCPSCGGAGAQTIQKQET